MGFIEALYPTEIKCVICSDDLRRDERWLCTECEASLVLADDRELPGLDGFCAGFSYTEELHNVIHSFKYEGGRYLAGFLSEHMVPPWGFIFDCIQPVPLYKDKLARRGYNQSMLLARELSERLNVPAAELIERVRDTPSQTKLSREERLKNLLGAFKANADCKQRRVLLVDDVCTTGATLTECALTLKRAGASAVYAITACA